jgi:hypothetical protein
MAAMAGRPHLLTPEVVQRAGELRERGAGIAEIGAALGLSRRSTFRALGRVRDDHDRQELLPHRPLTEADLVALLEAAARKGHVRAVELLLRRPWERDRVPASAGRSVIDELAARRER